MALRSDPDGLETTVMLRRRRTAATSLIEILVVIVVFTVGILAVVQIFPKGFRYLMQNRNSIMAVQVGRSEVERIKAHASELPEQILAVKYDSNGYLIADSDRDPSDLGPGGDAIAADGTLSLFGQSIGKWAFLSGANGFRRIIGESHVIPAPRPVGANAKAYGGVLLLTFGPVETHNDSNGVPVDLAVYGNDLIQGPGIPSDLLPLGNTDLYQSSSTPAENTFFVENPSFGSVALYIPTTSLARQYHLRFSGYVVGVTGPVAQDFLDIKIQTDAATGSAPYPYFKVNLAKLIPTLVGVDPSTLRLAPEFNLVANGADWTVDDPYEYKLLDATTGTLLFNPSAFGATVGREPIQARVDYNVLDWRIIREEYRLDSGTHALALRSLKVGGMTGPDGIANPGMASYSSLATTDPKADNFVLVDVLTGGILYDSYNGHNYLSIDKSAGTVTFNPVNSNNTNWAEVMLPNGLGDLAVPSDSRLVRAMYMAKDEWSVQVLKAASQYSIVRTFPPKIGECYVGGNAAIGGSRVLGAVTRVYFPRADANRKVTVGELFYRRFGSDPMRTINGQDFVIRYHNDPITTDNHVTYNLPSIDILDADSSAITLSSDYGYAIRNVKGASVAVRVLWNPDQFRLGNDPVANMNAVNVWGRGWRRSTTETYIQREELK